MRRDGIKIHGPYRHGRRWRCILVGEDGTRGHRSFETEAAAYAYITLARNEAQGVTVSKAIEAFIARARERGRALLTLETYESKLALILGSVSARSIRYVMGRGEELYAQACKGRAPDTHHVALSIAKTWGKFCVKQRWLKANPFADVETIGSKTLGADKTRLTVDEFRTLEDYCHAHASDIGAVATLTLLLLGMRSSELAMRNVRDLDDNGRLLWIGKTKSRAGTRRLKVPPELVPLLLELAEGRAPNEPLFLTDRAERWTHDTVRHHVRRLCKDAGMPVLSPQALRRTQASLAEGAGETGLAVARQLGHATGAAPAVTHRSYVDRDTARGAAIERGLRLIRGGRS